MAVGSTGVMPVKTIGVRVGDSSVLRRMGVTVGSSMDVDTMGGRGVGVGSSGALLSDSESEIPPMTSKSETMAMMTPPPI